MWGTNDTQKNIALTLEREAHTNKMNLGIHLIGLSRNSQKPHFKNTLASQGECLSGCQI